MTMPRNPEDYELPSKPQDAYDRGLDTQDESEQEDDAFASVYRDGSTRNECWREDDRGFLPFHFAEKPKKCNAPSLACLPALAGCVKI